MTERPSDEWFRLLASWSGELLSARDRVHYLIGNRHQPTKGSYREAILRQLLRRVLPDRFRVSTGFIYRLDGQPSGQLDILIWDAQEHSALLEEGELAILAPDSVAAVIEVKSALTTTELRKSLALLNPSWWINWRYTSEQSHIGLPQQVANVPFRAIFSYRAPYTDIDRTAELVFSELAFFYRRQFKDDAERALTEEESMGSSLWWTNMINVICFAEGPQIEQTSIMIDFNDGSCYHHAPGFASNAGHLPVENGPGENLAVGRFCMNLLKSLTYWPASEAARRTLRSSAELTTPGVCSLGKSAKSSQRLRVWGVDVPLERLWYPESPLWEVASIANHEGVAENS